MPLRPVPAPARAYTPGFWFPARQCAPPTQPAFREGARHQGSWLVHGRSKGTTSPPAAMRKLRIMICTPQCSTFSSHVGEAAQAPTGLSRDFEAPSADNVVPNRVSAIDKPGVVGSETRERRHGRRGWSGYSTVGIRLAADAISSSRSSQQWSFCLATNAERVCGEIMLKQEDDRRAWNPTQLKR